MSKALSPREVCSTTIGTRAILIRTSLRYTFVPFSFSYARVFAQKIEHFAIAQPVRDATFSSILCQDSTYLLFWLSRGCRNCFDLSFYFFVGDTDLFGVSNALQ